jgi:hypothetical protein
MTLDAQSYALSFSMLTNINADPAQSQGQIIRAEAMGTISHRGIAVST